MAAVGYAASDMGSDDSMDAQPSLVPVPDDDQLLLARNLCKTHKRSGWMRRDRGAIAALQDVSLNVGRCQTLGIAGESGAGKSTLARCLACLDFPDSGQVLLERQNLLQLKSSSLRRARRQVQLIFQGSAASLNPRFTAIEVVIEPAAIARIGTRAERLELGLALMESVGLPRNAAARKCSEFSGGERQRLAIARALSLSPKLLILDEALSGLDLLMQAQLVNLLSDLQTSRSMSYIFISHDLRLVAHLSDHLAVMQSGRIVEHGPVNQVSKNPQHPHTRTLLSASTRLGSPDSNRGS
jgi:ABC-type glutathione transport system ATPase component